MEPKAAGSVSNWRKHNTARVIRGRRAGHRHSEPSTPRSIAYCISLGGDCVVYLLFALISQSVWVTIGNIPYVGTGCARLQFRIPTADTSSDHHIQTFLVAGRHRTLLGRSRNKSRAGSRCIQRRQLDYRSRIRDWFKQERTKQTCRTTDRGPWAYRRRYRHGTTACQEHIGKSTSPPYHTAYATNDHSQQMASNRWYHPG